MYNMTVKNKENNLIGGNQNEVQQADHHEALLAAEKEGKESGWNFKVVCNGWVKGSHNRTYVSARIYTNAWNRKRDLEIGYIDNMTGELVAA